jgi:imidazolonepropionase-like amidohydrolase
MGFGPSLVSTIQLYTQLGLSPFEALQTATINAAKMAGHDDQGSLKAGNRADIVLLKSNPLVNIDALNEVADVMIGGVWVKDVEGME